uniref:Uncharacterized protein n=1 Tax=Cryptomonas curvata TaxID=233186 RepID=A0A7S0MET1_9CRYP
MVPRAHLEAARDEVQRLRTEISQVRSQAAGMRVQADAAREESARHLREIDRLQAKLMDNVARESELRVSDEMTKQLRAQTEDTISRVQHETVISRLNSEIEDLARSLQDSVPRERLDGARHRAEDLSRRMEIMQARENDAARRLETVWTELHEKSEEVEILRRQCAAVARELKSAQTEARELAATNEDLLRRMDEMVPRSRAQVLERELVACRAEFSSFASSPPKVVTLQSTQGSTDSTLETEVQRCQEELLRSWQEIELRSAEIERLHKLRVADQLQIEALDRLNRRLSDRVKASISNGGVSEKTMHRSATESPPHLSEFSEEARPPSVQRLC